MKKLRILAIVALLLMALAGSVAIPAEAGTRYYDHQQFSKWGRVWEVRGAGYVEDNGDHLYFFADHGYLEITSDAPAQKDYGYRTIADYIGRDWGCGNLWSSLWLAPHPDHYVLATAITEVWDWTSSPNTRHALFSPKQYDPVWYDDFYVPPTGYLRNYLEWWDGSTMVYATDHSSSLGGPWTRYRQNTVSHPAVANRGYYVRMSLDSGSCASIAMRIYDFQEYEITWN